MRTILLPPNRWRDRTLRIARSGLCGVLTVLALGPIARASDVEAAARFREDIQPILQEHCYGCHAEGARKGSVAFDGFTSEEELLRDRDLWGKVLKNVRAGIMPPAKQPRPDAEQVHLLADWIKQCVFGIDPDDPDPGRVTIRRLNRVEYRNTIRDLMGVDYRTDEEFPPDDTGYGFDNIGDVLTVSPLLLEKYMQAAEAIVAKAVPMVAKVIDSRPIPGAEFRAAEGKVDGSRMSFDKAAEVAHGLDTEKEGTYRVVINLSVRGSFDFDPGRCRFALKVDDREVWHDEFGWQDGKLQRFEVQEKWAPGRRTLAFKLEPLVPVEEEKKTSVDMRIASVVVEGPLEPDRWVRPKNFERFFPGDAPASDPERREYVRGVLARFAGRAFRRPVDDRTVDRLLPIAEEFSRQPGKSVEQGIAQAMVAVLASPRFLFRIEEEGESGRAHPPIDEYALASRLSYFLWSTMPDEELLRLAERGELRQNLAAQVKRMVDDPRAEMLIQNFAGQWLQARDVEGIAIEPRSVLARDDGEEKELQKEMEAFRAFLAERTKEREKADSKGDPEKKGQDRRKSVRARFSKLFAKPRAELDGPLRSAMRRETEMFFGAIVREDLSVLDLIDSDFTFLNERLARHYGIPGVTGEEMRRVALPPDSPRGGVLTQGTVLVVTSNPTRTSPVKRGLFLLDNILGTPPPPPPDNIPQLEASEKEFQDREPTLREVLALHRDKPLCNSCHSRMDPLGLALENFNAMGMWREQERNQPLDTRGELITGEPFAGIRDLKRILRDDRRADFYRCLTEKLLTYALGRGLEYTDVETVDRIVDRLGRERGRFSALLLGIVESAPFQKRRSGSAAVAASAAGRPGSQDEAARP